MTKLYLAAGIGKPEQCSRAFSAAFNLEPFLNATNDLALRKQLGLDANDFVIGKIGRLFKLKGHADLLAVVRQNSAASSARAPAASSATARCAAKLKTRSARSASKASDFHRPRAARRSRALCRHHGLPRASVVSRGACRARCRRRSPPASRSSPTISMARTKSASKMKPVSSSAPAILTPRRKSCCSSPTIPRCAKNLAGPARHFVRENFSVEKMVDDHIRSLFETGRRTRHVVSLAPHGSGPG